MRNCDGAPETLSVNSNDKPNDKPNDKLTKQRYLEEVYMNLLSKCFIFIACHFSLSFSLSFEFILSEIELLKAQNR